MKPCLIFLVLVCFGVGAFGFEVRYSGSPRSLFINTPYDEMNPVLSPDGKTLYFTIANHPENIGGKKDPGDIWLSTKTSSGWSAPVHGGTLMNDRGFNSVGGITFDGNMLFLLNHFGANGSAAKTQGISVMTKQADGWSTPENIVIPYFQNRSALTTGYITPDAKVFVFSADTYGSKGVDDIYVSFNKDGAWTEPRNLGAGINSKLQELSPFLAEDGETLYFSSNGLKGKGSFDVFSCTRLDESWTKWTEPVNVGDVNTEARDLFYKDFPSLGTKLFTSTKNSDGYGDVRFMSRETVLTDMKEVKGTKDMKEKDTLLVIKPVEYKKDVPSYAVRLYGSVRDAKSGAPISAVIEVLAAGATAAMGTSSDQGYEIGVPSRGKYGVRVQAKGYISTFDKLDLNTVQLDRLELNFALQPIEIGTTINLRSVLFAQSKADLLPESFDELDLVVSFLTSNPNVSIELSGHTDNRGVAADNLRLSQQRADMVRQYLISKGIEEKRITGKGYGGAKPISSNDTEQSRRLNRRVEFTIKRN